MHKVPIKKFFIGKEQPLTVMSGPCVIESEDHCLRAAEFLQKLFSKRKINFVFKSSYDKANRTSYDSFRGPGLEEGLRILQKVQREFDLPVLTDVHSPEEATAAGEVCDVIQIPAFLCRQTDLVVAAAQTKAVVTVKKGQFMSPWEMENVVKKIVQAGNHKIILIDRGTTFGYNNLVNDFRCIPIMQQFGYPVCVDATHSLQLPGSKGDSTGGLREFIPLIARLGIVAGANCLYMESHPNPKEAKSDADTVLDFKDLPALLSLLERLYQVCQSSQNDEV